MKKTLKKTLQKAPEKPSIVLNIFGQCYTVARQTTLQNNDFKKDKSKRLAGYCDTLNKEIFILKPQFESNLTMRHELLHAFFFEANLRHYSDDEKLIDFLAFQFPKILTAFKACNCERN